MVFFRSILKNLNINIETLNSKLADVAIEAYTDVRFTSVISITLIFDYFWTFAV